MPASDLLRRYDRPGPRYTSYPTAVEWQTDVDAAAYAQHLEQAAGVDAPLSLYLHLPFCEQRCLFCGCNVVVTKQRDRSLRYLEVLKREVRDVAGRLGGRRRLSQYHWGGGTPTYLSPDQMRALQAVVLEEFELEPGAEVAIEVDPRVTTPEHMHALRELGFNRLSVGVQDFTPRVQEAVNRVQPFEMTDELVRLGRELGFGSVNLDLIYGLPLQTKKSFEATLRRVLEIRPERLAVYSYAHVPWIRGQQRRIAEEDLPAPGLKLALFLAARSAFEEAGYLPVGMDHFVLPEDEMGLAVRDGSLWRNFMGYTVKHAPDMVACGMSGIGDVRGAYFQNERKLIDYECRVGSEGLAVTRGWVLSPDDQLRRYVITALMCAFRVDVADVERRFGVRFWDTFARERRDLGGMERDGLVRVADDVLEITGLGRLFVRNVCMQFDAYRDEPDSQTLFSRTV